jgi:Flagellar basal body-associated protein FliL
MAGKLRRRTVPEERVVEGTEFEPSSKTGFAIGKILKVRDLILESLTAKRSQDLINVERQNRLRREIQEKVAVYFRTPKLVDVMFTEFVIQL